MSAPIRAGVEADQLASPHLEENPVTRPESEHASAKPRVVRTLKDPPEIWDLVHETPAYFNPTGNFVARLASRKTNRILLMMLGVILISGLAAFAFITLRDGRTIGRVVGQVRERFGNSQPVPTSQASDRASASESAPNAPVDARVNTSPSDATSGPESALNAPFNTPVNTSPDAESVVGNTAPQPAAPPATDPQPTTPEPPVPSPDNSAFASHALTDTTQPTIASEAQEQAHGPVASNISKRTAARTGRTNAWSRNKRVTAASGGQNADKPADTPAAKPSDKPSRAREGSRVARPDTSAKPQTSQASHPLDLKRMNEKSSSDPDSANRGSSTTLSPQLIAPPTTTSAPKAKVIQWP